MVKGELVEEAYGRNPSKLAIHVGLKTNFLVVLHVRLSVIAARVGFRYGLR